MESGSKTLEIVEQKILNAARIAERIAERSLKTVRIFFMLGILSALWLSYYAMQIFHLSALSTLLICLMLALPAIIVFKLYSILQEVVGLTQRLGNNIKAIKESASEVKQNFQDKALPDLEKKRIKFFELRRLGRILLEIKMYAKEFKDIALALGGTLMLANPLFIILTGISAGSIMFLLMIALISVIHYAVRL